MSISQERDPLNRSLTLFPTTAIVIGSVVGSGIFVSSAPMARDLGNAPLLLGVWVLAGVFTFFGALTQCELVGQMPRTGGLYEYLREIYGERIGFLYGWANLVIAGSGSIAGLAFIFAAYLGEFISLPHLGPALEKWPVHLPLVGRIFPLADIGVKAVGAALVLFLTWLNARGVKLGAGLQSVSTSIKMAALFGIVAIALLAGGHHGHIEHLWSATPQGSLLRGWTLIGAVTMALSGAFWSYDGWGNVAYICGEVRNPAQTVPRAMVLGTLAFIGLYLVVNVAYLYILPIEALGKVPNDRVASSMIAAVLGGGGAKLVAAVIMLSTFDTTNSSVLTNARVYYAMARAGAFWKPAGTAHPRFRTPHVALWCQGLWSICLLFSGSFEAIVSMYVFVNWVLYVLMAVGVFLLRRRAPESERPFEIPGYPVIPALFVLFSSVYVVLTLMTDILAYRAGQQPLIKSAAGCLLVLTGVPFYLYWSRFDIPFFSSRAVKKS